jgi:hypothetical protein
LVAFVEIVGTHYIFPNDFEKIPPNTAAHPPQGPPGVFRTTFSK